MAQLVVSIGCEVDEGYTPLHYAAQNGNFEAVAKHAITKEGKTAFALAVEEGHSCLYDSLQLVDLLKTIKGCLAQGGKVNGRDQNGWTPLHRAAFRGQMESVRVLIGLGARVDLVDASGYTPLLRAVEGGRPH